MMFTFDILSRAIRQTLIKICIFRHDRYSFWNQRRRQWEKWDCYLFLFWIEKTISTQTRSFLLASHAKTSSMSHEELVFFICTNDFEIKCHLNFLSVINLVQLISLMCLIVFVRLKRLIMILDLSLSSLSRTYMK
jgi:hypothetical protein